MVDMEVVKERLMRGAFVGAGSFASSFAATFIEENLGLADIGAAGGQVATGLALSVGVDEVFTNPDSVPNDAVEYFGYGVQGGGFSNLAESVQTGAQTGRVVSVSANSRQQREDAQQSSQASTPTDYSLDTA